MTENSKPPVPDIHLVAGHYYHQRIPASPDHNWNMETLCKDGSALRVTYARFDEIVDSIHVLQTALTLLLAYGAEFIFICTISRTPERTS